MDSVCPRLYWIGLWTISSASQISTKTLVSRSIVLLRLTAEDMEALKGRQLVDPLTMIGMLTNAWDRCRSSGRCRRSHPLPQLQGSAGRETGITLHPTIPSLCLTYVLRTILIVSTHLLVQSVVVGSSKSIGDDS